MSYRQPTKAIITDAGFASRFLPITKTVPKAMLPLGNRPIMQLVVEECVAAGITEIIIVATPEGKSLYEDYFTNPCAKIRDQLAAQGKSDRYESITDVLNLPKVTVIEQDPSLPYGNGSPIASARQFIADDEAFIVAYSDDVVFGTSAIQELVASYAEHPDAAVIIAAQTVPHEEIKKYASVSVNAESPDRVEGLVEKPDPAVAPSDLASYGRYLLTPEVFEFLQPNFVGLDNELWTADAIAHLIPTGRVYVKATSGRWMTTGDPKNYCLAQLKYVLDHEDYAADVRAFLENN